MLKNFKLHLSAWQHALRNLIDPILVDRGPIQGIIQKKDDLKRAASNFNESRSPRVVAIEVTAGTSA